MKAFVSVIITFTALSATLAENSDRTDKRIFGSDHGTQFSSHNNHAQQQQQLDYHYNQPHQVHQHNQKNWIQPEERLNKAKEYYQHIQQQQLEWESQKQHAPVHHGINHYQHQQQNQGVHYQYAQQQDQHHRDHDYQQHHHQAQHQPHYYQQQQERLPHHHNQQQPQHDWDQHKQIFSFSSLLFPVQDQKHVPYPVAFEKNILQVVEKKAPIYEENQIAYQVDRPVQHPVKIPVQSPVKQHIQVIRKPVAVHVDKPYPVYVEHPVYMEKPVPMQVIIMKEKNKSLWG